MFALIYSKTRIIPAQLSLGGFLIVLTWLQICSAPAAAAFTGDPGVVLHYVDRNSDFVGRDDNGYPDGTRDGHFSLTVPLIGTQEIKSIQVWLSDPNGIRSYHFWQSNGPGWILGVFYNGFQLNHSRVSTVGQFTGTPTFDLYGDDAGTFVSGNYFLVEVALGSGQTLRQLTQIQPQWQAVDVTVGSDHKARLLWDRLDGSMSLWTVANSFNFAIGTANGPYAGFTARRTAAGADGLTRELWTATDGTAALWLVGLDNNYQAAYNYGPFPGWTVLDLSVGNDFRTRILWSNADGRAALWTVDNSGFVQYGPVYGPYAGWTPIAVAAGADGYTRVLWNNADGRADMWLVRPDNTLAVDYPYGPYPGWSAPDITVDIYNQVHVLWTHSDGRMAVWSVDNSGAPTYGPVYGPYTAFSARRLAAGTDGLTRVLWYRSDSAAALWLMDLDNTYLVSSDAFGPF